jgi:hypothetical protein
MAHAALRDDRLRRLGSLLKRRLKGTYDSVEPFHPFRYSYRENIDEHDHFDLALSHIVDKRLTWKQLTGNTQDPETRQN